MEKRVKRGHKFREERAEFIRWLDGFIERGVPLDREQSIRDFDKENARRTREKTRKLLVPEHGFERDTQVEPAK